MLTRIQFKRAMNRYMKHVEQCDRINQMFCEMHLEGSPVGVAEEIEGAFLELLTVAMEDEDDIICWWLFDTNAGINKDSPIDPVVKLGNGKEVHLDTLDDLYNFL